MITIEMARKHINGGQRAQSKMPMRNFLDLWFEQNLYFKDEKEGQEAYDNFQGLMQDHVDRIEMTAINTISFMGRVEREINKYQIIQRFYLRLMKTLDSPQKKMQIDWNDIEMYLEKKGLD